jgi:hypothetical protein
MKVIKYSVFIFVLLSTVLLAQNSIKFDDVKVGREHYVDVALKGTVTGNNISQLRVELIYDSRIIDIKSASGGTGFVMQEEKPDVRTDFSKLDSARLIITSHNVQAVTDGIICNLQIKGLVWSDSLAYVLPLRMFINGEEVETDIKQGIVTVVGTLIFPNFPDFLGNGYPNPFNYQVRFDFSLKKSSSVEFVVYTMNGIKVIDSDNSDGMLLVFSKESGIPLNDLTNLKEGAYYVLFTPKNQEIASQYFIFVMKTDRQVFNTNILYCK